MQYDSIFISGDKLIQSAYQLIKLALLCFYLKHYLLGFFALFTLWSLAFTPTFRSHGFMGSLGPGYITL
jgi:hypothetical protein